jgi:hypothetical protein
MSTPRLQNVDVPGDGNCGFYAFATGLIPILQRDIATGNQERLDKLENAIRHLSENDNTFAWDSFQNDIAEYCPPAEREKQIISHRTLDKFNRVLREILVTEQIESITEALKADSEADQENLYLMIMVNELIPLVQKELNEGNRQLFGNLHDCMLALCRKNPKDPTLFWDQFKRDIQEYKPGDLEKKQQIYNRFYRLLTGIKGTESQKFVYDELVKTFNTLFIDKLINQIKIEITSGSQTIIETLIADILKNNLRAITFTFDTLARDIRQNNKNMASKKLHELLGEQHISLFAKIFVKYKPLSSISRLEGNDIFNEIFGLLDYYININLNHFCS